MIDFLFFFLSFLANLAIVAMMPDGNLRPYINIYTIVGGCGALAFFLIYSRKAATPHIKKIGLGLLAIYAIAYIPLNGFWASVAIYPLFLIYNDYIVTQSNVNRGRNLYRIYLILSTLPFLFINDQFEILFQVRVISLAIILLFYIFHTSHLTTLQVHSTWKYIFFNYTFYYAPLLLIANMALHPTALKAWYIFAQGGLVVYLKYLDFALRKNHTVSIRMYRLILLAAVGAPILPAFIFPSTTGLIAYIIGLLGLIYSKRYIINH